MINNRQPFNDYDTTKMIVESKNFVFVLNESMSKVQKISKNDGSILDITRQLYDKFGEEGINLEFSYLVV